MRPTPTIGMLLPFVRGDYYGAMLSGASKQAAAAGGAIIALQTADTGSDHVERFVPPDLRHPFAWDMVDGFIVTVDAVQPEYIASLQRTGKPVILIGFSVDGLDLPVICSDNESGLRTVVRSLVEDGHSRIAFVGCLDAPDIAERHATYVRELAVLGIDADPRLCYPAGDNGESAGASAAERMLASGLPSTAVICGCDRNALGVIKTLTAAGRTVPDDQSVIGFDDIDEARYFRPALSTVRQYPERMGAAAITLIIDHIVRNEPIPSRSRIPTTFCRRQSSGHPLAGCSRADRPADPTTVLPPEERGRLPGDAEEIRGRCSGTEALLGMIEAAADDLPSPPESQVRSTLETFFQTDTGQENPVQVIEMLRHYATERLIAAGRAEDEAAQRRTRDQLDELSLVMIDEFARVQYATTRHFQDMFVLQYRLCMDLLRSHQQQPRQLGWLRSTPFRAACLGVWSTQQSEDADDPVLEIITLCSAEEGTPGQPQGVTPVRLPVNSLPVRAFPPRELCDLADPAMQEVVFVAPIKLGPRYWGMLAAVGRVDSRYGAGNEIMNHSVAMLAVALDYEDVLTSLRDREERMRRMAHFDDLTGLPNRALFLDRLREAILRAKRQPGYRYGVLFIDIDGFKLINDSLGRAAGDELLVTVAERVRGALRACDTAARLGGDEFVVLLDGIESLSAIDGLGNPVQVAERLQRSLGQPCSVHGRELFLTVSIGITTGDRGYDSADDVMRDADLAMHTAKTTRRGTHAMFDVSMHAQAVRRLEIEAGLRRALGHRELEVHYQPIVDLKTGRAAAAEALVRWRHPGRGLIPPGEFLSVAEESGLVIAMGRQILSDACVQLGEWRRSGAVDPQTTVGVNLSNKQFWHDDLLSMIDSCLGEAGLPPSALALEITEGIVMHNVDHACRLLTELHERGIALHIDDFGTGYSSLEALHQFPIDALKIDRSFVARLGTDHRSAELVRTIVMMSEILGIRVIAEGIETPDHRDRLRQLGCHFGQGFWFSRPAPADLAVEAMRRVYETRPSTTVSIARPHSESI
ncbi:MAG: EAL domain-containing protein [Micromonosporaceae bacterium]|nr:EAL domain-containing protein [Micromonosporaceae bacterium]